jgi:hypothetical protein
VSFLNEEVMYDRAQAVCNDKFVCIDTYSGYYGSWRDPQGVQHLLPPDATDQSLGAAILDALSKSRVAKYEEAPDMYLSRDQMASQNFAWTQRLMQTYGYATKRALFKKMKSCSIERRRTGLLTIEPTMHVGLEGWDGLPESELVAVPADCTVNELGAALRLAFSRCIA